MLRHKMDRGSDRRRPDISGYGANGHFWQWPVSAISLRMAWRNIRRHKGYTAIYVLGLSIGICACMVIYLIARFDLGFDKFHPNADRIYRIVGDFRGMRGGTMFMNSPIPEVAGIEHDIPGFEAQVGFHTFAFSITVPAQGGKAAEQFDGRQDGSYALSTILTGPSFFDLFPHQWLMGNPNVLNEPGKVVLAESAARRFFGPGPLQAMLGRTLIYEDSLPVTVAGIVKDWDKPSDLNYTSFISIRTAPTTWVRAQFPTDDWKSMQPHQSQAFVRLARGVDPATVNAALANYIRKIPITSFPGATHLRLYLQSLWEMHYTKDYHPGDTGDDFRQAYLPLLYGLMGVAVFILVLAIINFINLSTAQSLQRLKEVGIRKVMGSSRKGLVMQFLVETLLVTICAVLLSLALVRPALALFGKYIPYGVKFTFWDGSNLLFLLSITLVVTIAAGLYPARLLSSYLPVLSLKGALDKVGTGGAGLRRVLIIFQFSMSMLFIIASLAIGRQVRYLQGSDKGFSSDAILTIGHRRAKPWQMRLFAEKVRAMPGVEAAILQGGPPMPVYSGGHFVYNGVRQVETDVKIQLGDANFIPFYKMRLLTGRNLLPGDSSREVVINETYTRALELTPADAVGKVLHADNLAYTVVGVVADYHQESLGEAIQPQLIRNDPNSEKSLGVRLATMGRSGGEAKSIVAGIETEWKRLFPKTPFYYSFLNESIAWLYNEENRTAWLMQAAMVITILISCMGLFGLALFSAGRRAKEIGIRKVMGATTAGVALLLSRDFLRLVVIAIVIASPVAWYFTEAWLRDFAYRKDMDGWIVIEAGLGAIALALLTVGFQAVRAARANPVNSLRSE